MNKELIEHLLAVDVIRDAEKTTKHPYNQDGLTQRLAALNFVKRSQKLTIELKANSDTFRGMSFFDFTDTVISEGFVPCYNESFIGSGYGDKDVAEVLWAFYHESKGILLVVESFGGSMINRATMYYNWVPNQTKDWTRATSTGGFVQKGVVWQGHHEVNEALRYHLELLQSKGFFLKQWVEQPHLWLLNYVETRSKIDPAVINKRKLETFPEIVRIMIKA